MRCAARTGNNDAKSALVCLAGVLGDILGRPVRAHYARFKIDSEFLKRLAGLLHHRPVRIAAHQDSNFHVSERDFKMFSSSSLLFSRKDSSASRGTASGDAMRKVARENGNGIMNASQLLTVILCATSTETGMLGDCVRCT